LFERFIHCGNLILRAKAFALYETIARLDCPREQIPGLLCARFVTMPKAIERKLQRAQKSATFCTSPIPLSVNLRCGSSSSDFDSPC
jgi:hypothetical protein